MTNWLKRWDDNQIGWHKCYFNKRLVKFLPKLELQSNSTIFIPLCGKTLDILYILDKGYKVIAVELSELAVTDFFKENNIDFKVKKKNNFLVFKAKNLRIYCGDIFDLTKDELKNISAIYDRAAIIALSYELRQKYVEHLTGIITNQFKWLLLTMDYPQGQKDGPPYALNFAEIKTLFAKNFDLIQLESIEDLKNEPKFIASNVDFLKKETYLLTKKEIIYGKKN